MDPESLFIDDLHDAVNTRLAQQAAAGEASTSALGGSDAGLGVGGLVSSALGGGNAGSDDDTATGWGSGDVSPTDALGEEDDQAEDAEDTVTTDALGEEGDDDSSDDVGDSSYADLYRDADGDGFPDDPQATEGSV